MRILYSALLSFYRNQILIGCRFNWVSWSGFQIHTGFQIWIRIKAPKNPWNFWYKSGFADQPNLFFLAYCSALFACIWNCRQLVRTGGSWSGSWWCLHGLASVNCCYGLWIRNTLVRFLICRIPALIHPDAFLFAKFRILTPLLRNYFYGLRISLYGPPNYLDHFYLTRELPVFIFHFYMMCKAYKLYILYKV